MNSASWLTFFNLLLNTPSQLNEIQIERQQTIECLKQKKCMSVWDNSLQDWVIYRLDNLQETCGASPSENKAASDPNGACKIYYERKNMKKSSQ